MIAYGYKWLKINGEMTCLYGRFICKSQTPYDCSKEIREYGDWNAILIFWDNKEKSLAWDGIGAVIQCSDQEPCGSNGNKFANHEIYYNTTVKQMTDKVTIFSDLRNLELDKN